MAILTPKENYLKVGNHEIPEWVPTMMPYKDHGPATASAGLFAMGIGQGEFKTGWTQPHGEWKDFWGASYIWEEGVIAGLPKPNAFILSDVTKWDKEIKAPVVPDLDYAAMAKAELEGIDRTQLAVRCDLGLQPYQQLVAMMGFTETLCAMYEEPEAVKELLNYIADWWVPLIEKVVEYWKPDVVTMADDTAAKLQPFFSVEMYDEIYKPIYARIIEPAKSRGVQVDFHNCGRCEDFVPSMIDVGVDYWNPCQSENNMLAVKENYGKKIVLSGCWEYEVQLTDDEDTVRGYVRKYLDTFAKDGGLIAMAFAGDFMAGPEEMAKWGPINGWLSDEIYEYGTKMYK
jgi:hypothetical protein